MIIKDKEVLARLHREANGCEIPGCHETLLHAHHIFARGIGGGRRLDIAWNLILLCFWHHREAQNYRLKLSKAEQRRYLWGLAAEREIFRLLRQPKKGVSE